MTRNRHDVPPGSTARCATPLRPSGKVAIDGTLVHARAEGEWFDVGQEVAVLRADAFGLVVGRPGTASLALRQISLPQPEPEPEQVDGWASRLEAYLVGLMAFVALGTFLGGITLLGMAFLLGPVELLRVLPVVLGGGVALGLVIYHLALLASRGRRGARHRSEGGRRVPRHEND